MSDKTSLGDRMKFYETRFTQEKFTPLNPIIARLDGRAFHNFTRGLQRPFDKRLSDLMIETTKYLVEQSYARCGYTQSDEISLVWLAEEFESEIFFAGKLQKMNSILASMATAFFNKNLEKFLPEKVNLMPIFDCRVFQVPNEKEAVNCFIWREQDATRNSIQSAARSIYSHNECNKKNASMLQEMLFKKGVNWNDYPSFFKRGTYIRRHKTTKPCTIQEISELHPQHDARKNPNLEVQRTLIYQESMPQFSKISNRIEVLLYGAEPILTG